MYPFDVILDLFVIHGMCQKIIARTVREFNLKYPYLPPITHGKFMRIKNNFVTYGRLERPTTRVRPIRDNEQAQITILGYFRAFPRNSIRAAEMEIGFSYATIQRVLKDHRMHPYSFIRLQKLYPNDFLRRISFTEDLVLKMQEKDDFLKDIIWTDEAKFCQRGVYNLKNRHFWASDNPHKVYQVEHQIQFKLNVFCLVMDNLCVFHIYNESLNGEKYLEILQTVVEPFLDNLPVARMVEAWYQMDGAPAHNTNAVYTKLSTMFGDHWWGNRGPFLWPARSPDLTPLDFYVWGRLKEIVYATPVVDIDDLRQRIIDGFNSLNPFEIRSATQSVSSRILKCLNENGEHIEHLL